MKNYKFLVSLCNGWCDGILEIKADNEDNAYDKAMDYVVNSLVKVFPTLEIDYNVECQNPDECCEYCDKVISDDENYHVFKEEGCRDIYVCEKCLKEKYGICEMCGEYFLSEDLWGSDGGVICSDCYDKVERYSYY